MLHVTDGTMNWISWFADVMFDRGHIMVTAVQLVFAEHVTQVLFSQHILPQFSLKYITNYTFTDKKPCKYKN